MVNTLLDSALESLIAFVKNMNEQLNKSLYWAEVPRSPQGKFSDCVEWKLVAWLAILSWYWESFLNKAEMGLLNAISFCSARILAS